MYRNAEFKCIINSAGHKSLQYFMILLRLQNDIYCKHVFDNNDEIIIVVLIFSFEGSTAAKIYALKRNSTEMRSK